MILDELARIAKEMRRRIDLSEKIGKGDPEQVIDVLRDVLVKHMDETHSLPECRIQRAVYISRFSGRPISNDDSAHDRNQP